MADEYEDEIDLIDLVKYFWSNKMKVIIPCLIASVVIVCFSVLTLVLPPEKSPLPNKYMQGAA